MLLAAIILNILCALGVAILALKYLIGPVPADYHGEMLAIEGTTPSKTVTGILGALYRILGFALIAVAISLVAITLTGIRADLFWAKLLVLVIGLIIGIPSMIITRKMEQLTTVKTPWRMAAILSGGIIIAFVLAVV